MKTEILDLLNRASYLARRLKGTSRKATLVNEHIEIALRHARGIDEEYLNILLTSPNCPAGFEDINHRDPYGRSFRDLWLAADPKNLRVEPVGKQDTGFIPGRFENGGSD